MCGAFFRFLHLLLLSDRTQMDNGSTTVRMKSTFLSSMRTQFLCIGQSRIIGNVDDELKYTTKCLCMANICGSVGFARIHCVMANPDKELS